MLSNHVCRTDLSNREDKLNTIQLISGHSYSLYSELPRAPFQSTRLFAYTSTILTGVVSPTRIEENMLRQCRQDWKAPCISVPNATHFLSRLSLLNRFSVHNFFAPHWELPNELAFPPDSKLFKDPQVQQDFSSSPNTCFKSSLRKFAFIMVTITFLREEKSPA